MVSRPAPTRSAFAQRHPRIYLGLHGIAGLLVAGLCAWAFFAIAEEIPENKGLVRLDNAVAQWMERHGTEPGETMFAALSQLGSHILAVILIATAVFFLVRRDWRHLVTLAIAAGGGALLNTGIKSIFHRARPMYASEFPVSSWSFPSGHAMDSLIGYGLLAYCIAARFPRMRRGIYAAAITLIILIGFSRIYLGVHFLSDVLAGFTAGTVWLIVCVTGYEFAERRRVGSPGADERQTKTPT
jgi:membrane-associated phospholipid phosphatase